MSDFNIRSYHSSDNDHVYNICLQTGDSGKDATKLFNDPVVLGHIYAGPYMEYEPQSVFILNDDSGVCGYILGTINSNAFYDWMNKDWFPVIRKNYNQHIGYFIILGLVISTLFLHVRLSSISTILANSQIVPKVAITNNSVGIDQTTLINQQIIISIFPP